MKITLNPETIEIFTKILETLEAILKEQKEQTAMDKDMMDDFAKLTRGGGQN